MTHKDPDQLLDWERNMYFKRRKSERNKVYLWCGALMFLSMAYIGLYKLNRLPEWIILAYLPPVLLGETIAIEAFGISWLVKGQAIKFLSDVKYEPRSFKDLNGETLTIEWKPRGKLDADAEPLYETYAGAYQARSSRDDPNVGT